MGHLQIVLLLPVTWKCSFVALPRNNLVWGEPRHYNQLFVHPSEPKPKSATQQRAQAGAAARWGTRNINSSRPAGYRAWRRKENTTESGTHRQYDLDELVKWYVL